MTVKHVAMEMDKQYSVLLGCGILAVLHTVLAHMPEKARWFALHSLVNLCVVQCTIGSAYCALTYPITTDITVNDSVFPSILVMLLHLYHACFYKCNGLDYLHHVIMMFILAFPLYYNQPEHYELSNYCLFFTCGLPGGIDYFMMYMVQTGKMEYLTEKKWNRRLNTWIRAPGILYGAFMCWQHYLISGQEFWIHFITALVLLWNAQFFSELVAVAYGYTMAREKYSSIKN